MVNKNVLVINLKICERSTIFNNIIIITFSQSEIIIDSDQLFFDTNFFMG